MATILGSGQYRYEVVEKFQVANCFVRAQFSGQAVVLRRRAHAPRKRPRSDSGISISNDSTRADKDFP